MPTRPSLPAVDAKPFYASLGAGDAAVSSVRSRVTALPARVTDVSTTLPTQLKAAQTQLGVHESGVNTGAQVKALPTLAQTIPAQAKELRSQAQQLPSQVKELRAQAEQLPAQVQQLRTQVREQAAAFSAKAEKLYDELATRGEQVFAQLRGDSKPAAKPASKPAAKKTTKPAASSPSQVSDGRCHGRSRR